MSSCLGKKISATPRPPLPPAEHPILETLVRGRVASHTAKRLRSLSAVHHDPRPGAREIPRLIHQIWLGSRIPRDLAKLSRSWVKHHPTWTLKLWTDDDVAALDFANRDLFEAADCYGQKSDILRAELISRFGGFYVDLDYECLGPIDSLVTGWDFVTTAKHIPLAHLGWPRLWTSPQVACNSFFGARPGHAVPADYLRRVREAFRSNEATEWRDDELPPMSLRFLGGKDVAARIKQTGVRTYLPFHESVLALARRGRDGVLPASYLNSQIPGWWTMYLMPEFWERARAASDRFPDLRALGRVPPHAVARHLSKARWLKRER